MYPRSFFSAGLAAISILATSLPPPAVAQTQAEPDGAISLSGGAVAAGIGFVWGSGQLSNGGAPHTFTVSGLSVVDVGAVSLDASGSVYNLKNIDDFNGTYTTFAAGATIAGGGGVAYLRNQKGVVIKLSSTSTGLRFNLSAEGVTLKLQS